MARQQGQNAGRTFQQAVQRYVQDITSIYMSGKFSEKAFRTPLENFLNAIKPSPDYEIRQEQTSTTAAVGIPDYTVTYKGKTIGFIETKNIGTDLDSVQISDQIEKYRTAIDNVLLTDYKRFILLQETALDCSLFPLSALSANKVKINQGVMNTLQELLDVFFKYNAPPIDDPETLAKELAQKAKLVRWYAFQELESDNPCNAIVNYSRDLRFLIPDADNRQTADAYAQTISYGLFLAKLHAGSSTLQLNTAFTFIPGNEGVIQAIFRNASTSAISDELRWAVQQVVDVLNNTDISKVLFQMNAKSSRDPIIYLYEDFLASYNPEEKENRGVFYTPVEVADFIVRNTDTILKNHFGKEFGLANHDVKILDPAAGTGTFLLNAFEKALETVQNISLSAITTETIQTHLLQHFYGFEILVTPYVIAHLKLMEYLEHKWGYKFGPNDRIRVYLTNALSGESQLSMFASAEVSEENESAKAIKESSEIIAVMGNPPYKAVSVNDNPWINNLVAKNVKNRAGTFTSQGYAELNGHKLGENTQWLKDDYVKFIRLAQCMIDNNPQGGVVGYITNHSYLDNPTFRWMRLSLMKSFNRIYIVNLHGNSRRKEKAPDGRNDTNIFNIQQGTAIGIFIKNPDMGPTRVFYADVWGTKAEKLEWLSSHSLDNVEWQELNPTDPDYFFVPIDTTGAEKYMKYPSIKDIFNVSSTGIVTSHDSLVIDFDPDQLAKRIIQFRDSSLSDQDLCIEFGIKQKKGWDIPKARKRLSALSDSDITNCIRPILYRPFDQRWIFYDKSLVWDMAPTVMEHMRDGNIGIVVSRNSRPDPWRDALATDKLTEFGVIATRPGNSAPIFPLYLYSDSERLYNFKPEFISSVKSKYGDNISLEDIFYYIYAILYSPTYRNTFSEFLKRDFPRIPLVDDIDSVRKLSQIGKELIDLHLMNKGQFWINLANHATFDVEGTNCVERIKYDAGKVWINDEQYFDNIPQECWDFYIGSYRVIEKWLKSRKKKQLTSSEITTFIGIVEAIKCTMDLQQQIDSILAPYLP